MRRRLLGVLAVAALLAFARTGHSAEVQLLPLVQSHYDTYLQYGLDRYGPLHTANWMASLDTNTKNYPATDYALAGKRVYRENPAPKGSTLYFDIPQIDAALMLSEVTGDPKYRLAAEEYARTYLIPVNAQGHGSRIPANGLWRWGDHFYYRAFDSPTDELDNYYNDRYRGFSGSHHEMRPYTPNWDFFYSVLPADTIQQVHASGQYHVANGYATTTGQFSRHDTLTDPHAFLDSGGVLVESLTWLAAQDFPSSPLTPAQYQNHAKLIAQYSYNSRHPTTGLMRNNLPSAGRWDYHVLTSEVGEWAAKLLKAAEYTGDLEYLSMARGGVYPWLQYAWDPATSRYYGKVNVTTGAPDFQNTTQYQPFDYSSPWNVMIPSHDHFLGLAESLVELHRWGQTHHPEDLEMLETNLRRMAAVIMEERPAMNAKDGVGSYAEPYGQAIKFMLHAGEQLADPSYRRKAERLAHEAISVLHAGDMFRTHGGEDRYDAVDGFGVLAQALIELGSYHAPADPVASARYSFAGDSWQQSSDAAWHSSASLLNIGSGLLATPNSGGGVLTVSLNSAQQATQPSAASASDFVSFTVAPAEGERLELSHLTFDLRRSTDSASSTHYFLRSSVDGFTENLAADELSSSRMESYFVSLLDDGFQGVDSSVEFRLYFNGGVGGTASLDNITLYADSYFAGDYNGDGLIDAADYTVWRDSVGSSGHNLTADGDRDGMVGPSDLAVWSNAYGRTRLNSATATPEPSTLMLLAFGCTLGATSNRRPIAPGPTSAAL